MKPVITIIATGSEITAGRSIDTNSAWIASELFGLGWKVRNFLALPDDPKVILEELENLKNRASLQPTLVIMTGGMGPTADDFTLECIQKLQNKNSIVVEKARIKLEAIYKSRGKTYEDILPSVLRQTKVPEDSFILDNSVGIAPGFVENLSDSSYLVCMPGVPSEMKEMFQRRLLPFLKRTFEKGNLFQMTRWVWNIGESLFQSEFIEKELDLKDLEWGVTAQKGFIKAIFQSESSEVVQEATVKLQNYYKERCTIDVFQKNHEVLTSSRESVAVAESCTGGLLGKRLTDLPGSSAYFKGGVLTYSNQLKKDLLDVNAVDQFGAVSKEVAIQMAESTLSKFQTNYALSITGIAGPDGGSQEKPVGLVYIAVASKNKETFCKEFRFPGNRDTIRENAANSSLYLLHLRLEGIV